VFIGSQNRGFIQNANSNNKPIGTFEQRQQAYITRLMQSMANNFANLNMDTNIEEWFITRAKSSNPYQKQEDNREIELKTVLQLLHEIDSRIDPEFMQISGDERVSILVDGQHRMLSQLSTGFSSILKIIQSIISGFAYFTNETQLQTVKGIVLIDEIESHLHLSWQAKIIPMLKRLFPNTTFYITTHSSIIFSQLKMGEAYRLKRDHDGVVRTQLLESPANASMVDLLKEAFGINLNQLKLDHVLPEDQEEAKSALLSLIQEA
jgi:predicted ATP-binding protein involved in virulence